jgi:thiol-disulfide isomerase/thioredoxin
MNFKRTLALAVSTVIATGAGALAGAQLFGIGTAHAAAEPVAANAVAQLWAAAVTSPDGKPQSLERYKGHVVVVNFWASWCGPCVREMPELSQLQRDYAKKGVQFVGLGVDSDQNVTKFLQKVAVSYPVYVIGFGGADLARAFGNNAGGLPFTVVIDAKGHVRSTKLGEIQPNELKATLDSL